jgi:UDP-N-acetylglucosamine 2-epimerase (non-hydrolysing)
MRRLLVVAGARPNYVKVAPLVDAWRQLAGAAPLLVDTGQHYDDAMADVFFRDLGLPEPDRDLGVGSGTHAVQTARMMTAFEAVCLELRPGLVVVVGDVNSTLAAALVAAKLTIPLAHVEAGLRSFDRTMPEEVNRVVTDQLADLLFTPSRDAGENLAREGIPPGRVHFVGNVMIDTLERCRPRATFDRVRDRFPVEERTYALLTLHRPANVDRLEALSGIAEAIRKVAGVMPVIFPVHPRTRGRLAEFGLGSWLEDVILTEPLGYLDFLALTAHARVVLTDSGGLQEETTALGVPCVTLRESTERPVTVTEGTNRLAGTGAAAILEGFHRALAATGPGRRPELWDGRAAGRIAAVLQRVLAER